MVTVSRPWTTRETALLAAEAWRGLDALTAKLGRSRAAIKTRAHRDGISLRCTEVPEPVICPACGRATYRPLEPRTGWCATCIAERNRRDAEARRERAERESAAEAMRLAALKKATKTAAQGAYRASKSHLTCRGCTNKLQTQTVTFGANEGVEPDEN